MKNKVTSSDKAMLALQHSVMTDLMPSVLQKAVGYSKSWTPVDFRNMRLPQYHEADSYTFKKIVQCEDFLKRYRFENDLHTEDELHTSAANDFVKSQALFGNLKINQIEERVLEKARRIVTSILGPFDLTLFAGKCKMGKRAAKGLKARRAYLDTRSENLTCTELQKPWFSFFQATDKVFRRSFNEPLVVDAVTYTTVPKSFKAMRGIAPDVSFGGFLSQGLGRYIRSRLEEMTPIQLSHAQEQHKALARIGSKDGSLATIDMSKASDSFVWEHIERLVPSDWQEILKVVRVSKVDVEGKVIDLTSYMLMGSGHTFPLQTLLFYSLAKAFTELCKNQGPVRVFGDDIILPSRYSKNFCNMMENLGFFINEDKSFCEGHFRESCGGDYHKGVDVRPAMPEGSFELTSKRRYTSFLFKVYNSLLAKWDFEEIPTTIALLYSMIIQVSDAPLGVIGLHAADSCLLYECGLPTQEFKVLYKNSVAYVEQRILVPMNKLRVARREDPYYWDSLRGLSTCELPDLVLKGSAMYDQKYLDDPINRSSKNICESRKGVQSRLCWKKVRRLLRGPAL